MPSPGSATASDHERPSSSLLITKVVHGPHGRRRSAARRPWQRLHGTWLASRKTRPLRWSSTACCAIIVRLDGSLSTRRAAVQVLPPSRLVERKTAEAPTSRAEASLP